ncbi:ribosome hibernation-promoting factor, HPF/YfiA family [Tuberibacillus sp. Marseille-P3662]|uniref:ribosome hibernation-promoting factor, HPF/YfiA family n=1 Tax=Tuberibacillus sp. Marseille-P3662 TaxID=1965358 RepID=UPI000A1CAB3F|nr:ribosome-associated translation inhibitor RaiA [Tuberibacillus sp. Marseille-P3662]
MNYNIRGENFEVTEALKDYVDRKLGKLEKYFDEPITTEIRVNMEVHNNDRVIEVTIPMQELLLRAEDTHTDMYAAIDLVTEKLERQIRKYKTKVNRKFRQSGRPKQWRDAMTEGSLATATEVVEEEESEFEVVRNKRFDFKPMNVDEAILQMNMLGHTFFVFNNDETNDISVVYKRKDGKYGLIEQES